METISKKPIQRLILYKKILNQLKYDGVEYVFSHVLSKLTGFSANQIRRDLMLVGYTGTPSYGYEVAELEESISKFIDDPDGLAIAIVGVGKLGCTLLNHCNWSGHNLRILVGFDIDKKKVGKSNEGYEIFHISQIEKIVKKEKIYLGVLACPDDNAQEMAERLVSAGVQGILNYTKINLILPEDIYVEDTDIMLTMKKISFFTRHKDIFKKKKST